MNPTKIVATLGPASESEEMIRSLIDVGLDVARLNFSHGTHERHEAALSRVRRVADERALHLAVLGDLCGPKLRIGQIAAGAVLHRGDECRVTRQPLDGDGRRFSTNHAAVIDEAQVGHRLLIDDGLIQLCIIAKAPDELICRCDVGGKLSSAKGLILPDTDLSLPSLTEKDERDVEWAIRHQLDYLALSFVRRADDVITLRERLNIAGANIPIVSKIETPQAIENLDDIIRVSDALLVARGDLGVMTDLTRVPLLQKDMIARCSLAGRPVIVATQMLQSMVDQPTPTRAEVSDVANAVFDGADAVMLSAETASGQYPLEALRVMNQITQGVADYQRRAMRGRGEAPGAAGAAADASPGQDSSAEVGHDRGFDDAQSRRSSIRLVGADMDPTTAAVARSAANVAADLDADWLAVWCRTGTTAAWISKYRPRRAIVGFSSDPQVCHRLSLLYGVIPYRIAAARTDVRAMLLEAARALGLPPAPAPASSATPPSASPHTSSAPPVRASSKIREALVLLVGNPQATRREPVISIHRIGAPNGSQG